MAPILPLLQAAGIVVNMAGPGEHVPVAKKNDPDDQEQSPMLRAQLAIRHVSSATNHVHSFCVSRINMQPSTTVSALLRSSLVRSLMRKFISAVALKNMYRRPCPTQTIRSRRALMAVSPYFLRGMPPILCRCLV